MRSLFATIYASLIFTALVLLKCEANSITQLDDQHGVSDPPSGFDSKPLSMSQSSINNASQTANSNSANGDPKPDRATFLQYFKIRDIREKCPDDMSKANQSNESDPSKSSGAKFCPPVSDPLLCFPATPANQTLRLKCPYKEDLNMPDTGKDGSNNISRRIMSHGHTLNIQICVFNSFHDQAL